MNSRSRAAGASGSSSRQLRSQHLLRHHVPELQRPHRLLVDERREDVLTLRGRVRATASASRIRGKVSCVAAGLSAAFGAAQTLQHRGDRVRGADLQAPVEVAHVNAEFEH